VSALDLNALEQDATRECDVLIVGAGPAGLTVARGLSKSGLHVVAVESGKANPGPGDPDLNAVDADPDAWSPAQAALRQAYHGPQFSAAAPFDHDTQRYGVRARGIGGSTRAWAGKLAAFPQIDFEARPWASSPGWPIARQSLQPYMDKAAQWLNLGPNLYDDALWSVMRRMPPDPALDSATLQSFFWQFSRSRLDQTDVMRVGPEFLRHRDERFTLLTNATAVEVLTDETGGRATGVRLANADGARAVIRARAVVLAASAVENARLLLLSRARQAAGLGNGHDQVGRCLMDHPGGRIAVFDRRAIPHLADRFGFFSLRHPRGVAMYQRGLTLPPGRQRMLQVLNAACYLMSERASDNPWDALKRLMHRRSNQPLADIWAVMKSPGLLAKGIGRRAVQSRHVPAALRTFIVEQTIRLNPNFAVEEFLTGGLPHKLTRVTLDGLSEQEPDPANRVTLSARTDALGVPLPHVRWRIGEAPRRSLAVLGRTVAEEFARVGLPPPQLADWIVHNRLDEAELVDMAHSFGTTRMSETPQTGVVNRDCRVHGTQNVYVAGGSVFPTSGHANPTLMIVALSLRLAEHLRDTMTR
jgi:choline dehydrogenase-like flavoprotein